MSDKEQVKEITSWPQAIAAGAPLSWIAVIFVALALAAIPIVLWIALFK